MNAVPNTETNLFVKKRSPRGWRFFGAALGALLAVAVAPGTGWIVRKQLNLLFFNIDIGGLRSRVVGWRYLEAASRMPDDSAVQVALAFRMGEARAAEAGESHDRARYAPLIHDSLRSVQNRFPTDPLPYAAAVHNYTSLFGYLSPERYQLQKREPSRYDRDRHLSAADQENLIRLTREGERRDPENAFFPMMRAAVYVAAHQEEKVAATMGEAAVKPRWNSYLQEIHQGALRLEKAAFGERASHERERRLWLLSNSSTLQAGNVAYLVVWQAIMQERAGNFQAGLALRGRVMRLGVLIRDQSRDMSGVAKGMEMFNVAKGGAGGVLNTPIPQGWTDAIRYRLDTEYLSYLKTRGWTQEADWVRQQTAINEATSAVFSRYIRSSAYDIFRPLAGHWLVGAGLLVEGTVFALAGLLIAFYRYRKRFSPRLASPLPNATRWGIALGTFASFSLLLPVLSGYTMDSVFGLVMLLNYIGIVFLLASRAGAQHLRLCLRAVFMTVLYVVGGFCLVMGMISPAYAQWTSALEPRNLIPMALLPASVFVALLLLVAAGFFLAWKRCIPMAFGGMQQFSKTVLPVTSLLLLGYVGMVFQLAPKEAAMQAVQQLSAQDEIELVHRWNARRDAR